MLENLRAFSTAPQSKSESFLSGSSSLYVEAMLENYENDPNSVPESWRQYFEGLEGKRELCDEKTFNQPTIVLSSGVQKNASSNLVG